MPESSKQVSRPASTTALLVFVCSIVFSIAGGLPELLRALDNGIRPGDQFRVSETELNQFIREEVETNRVAVVRAIDVKIQDGWFKADLLVDLDKVDLGQTAGAGLFRSLLSGVQKIQLEGIVEGKDGMVRYETKSAALNSLPIPGSLVDVLLKQLGEKQDPPFDPTQPIAMPRGLQTLRLVPGAVELGG